MSSFMDSNTQNYTRKKDKYREERLELERLALQNRLKALENPYQTNQIIYMANTLRDEPKYALNDTIKNLNKLNRETTNKHAKRAIDEAILSIKKHHKWNHKAGGTKRTRSKRITRRRRL